jgi:hypothetical protein
MAKVSKRIKVKAKAKGFGEVKIHNPDLNPKQVNAAYSFMVKGGQRNPNQTLLIDGQAKSIEVGQTIKATLDQLNINEVIKDVFKGILPKVDLSKGNVALSIKAGYGVTQFGLTKPGQGNSWHGFITFTDNQLCWHCWDNKGIVKDVLHDIRQSNKLNINRQGANWLTVSYNKNNVDKCINACLELLNKV